VAGLLAVAAFGVVMGQAFEQALRGALSTLALPDGTADVLWARRHMVGALQPPAGLDAAAAHAVKQAVAQAFGAGYERVMAWCALLAVLSAAGAALLIRRSRA
jgi:hypothetical protein